MPSNLYEISAAEQARMLKLLRKHRKTLLKYPNVHSVDVGYEFTGGSLSARSGRLCSIKTRCNHWLCQTTT